MTRSTPLISVTMTTYNHEKYIGQAIASVLGQTFSDFELVVVNDGSRDNTEKEIKKFHDQRLVYIVQDNQGPSVAANVAIQAARGQYIAYMAGDDVCYPHRLESQLQKYREGPSRVLFSHSDFIDDNGVLLDNSAHERHFAREAGTREQTLRQLFYHGNFLNATTSFTESSMLLANLCNPVLLQMQDFDLWLRLLVAGYPVEIIPQKLVQYRIRAGNGNLSAPTTQGNIRTLFEYYWVLQNYLGLNSVDEFLAVFPEQHQQYAAKLDKETIPFAVAMAALNCNFFDYFRPAYRLFGLHTLFNLLQQRQIADKLRENFGFSAVEFIKITGEYDISGVANLSRLQQQLNREYQNSQEAWKQWQETNQRLLTAMAQRHQHLVMIDELQQQQHSLQAEKEALEITSRRLQQQTQELSESLTQAQQRLALVEDQLAAFQNAISVKIVSKLRQSLGKLLPEGTRRRALLRAGVRWCKSAWQRKRQPYVKSIRPQKWPGNRPLVSVVIPCGNSFRILALDKPTVNQAIESVQDYQADDYAERLGATIDSVLAQTWRDLEIIVVVGAVAGSGIAGIAALAKKQTVIYRRRKRYPLAANYNYGINKARGKYICCLEVGDILAPTYLEKALYYLETTPCDLVYPLICQEQPAIATPVPPQVDFLNNIEDVGKITRVAVFSKYAWRKCGGLIDSGLGNSYFPEHQEFWTRLLGQGYRCKLVPESLVNCRARRDKIFAANGTAPARHWQLIRGKNHKLFSEKNHRYLLQRQRYQYLVADPHTNLRRNPVSTSSNILFALPFTVIGGANTVLLQTARYLKAKDYNLHVLTSLAVDASYGDSSCEFAEIAGAVYQLPAFLNNEREFAEFLFYLLAAKNIDLIFQVGCEVCYHLLPQIKERFGHIKIVDQLYNEFGHLANNRRYAAYIDRHIVANSHIRDILINEYQEAPEKIAVIIHGVDSRQEFNPDKITLTAEVESLINAGQFVVSFFGRFSEEKAPEVMIELAVMRQDCADIFFVMIGNGPLYPQISQQIHQRGLQSSLYAPGFVADIKPFLRRSQVLVIPSQIEGIPIILLEAMAMGVPVVASRVGGIPEVITPGYNGFLCDSGNIADFNDKIDRLYRDRELHAVIAKNAREYAWHHIDLATMNANYHREFAAVLTDHIPPKQK